MSTIVYRSSLPLVWGRERHSGPGLPAGSPSAFPATFFGSFCLRIKEISRVHRPSLHAPGLPVRACPSPQAGPHVPEARAQLQAASHNPRGLQRGSTTQGRLHCNQPEADCAEDWGAWTLPRGHRPGSTTLYIPLHLHSLGSSSTQVTAVCF